MAKKQQYGHTPGSNKEVSQPIRPNPQKPKKQEATPGLLFFLCCPAVLIPFLERPGTRRGKKYQYKKLIRKLKPDDLLYIKSIDRLGRNYEEIQNQWRIFTKEKRSAL